MKKTDYINFRGNHQTHFFEDDEEERNRELSSNKHNLTPTELIKFVPESVIEEVSMILDRIFISDNRELAEIDIPNIIETKSGFFEEVSDLNGIAIPCIYYDYLSEKWSGSRTNSNILLNLIGKCVDNMKPNEHIYLKNIVDELPEKIETIDDYLYVANISVAVQETLYFKVKQIHRDEYNWLTKGMINSCTERLENVIGKECKDTMPRIEETIIHQSDNKAHIKIDEFLAPYFGSDVKFRFTARTDLITSASVWEMKCTSKISIDHMLQVVIYAWLWKIRISLDDKQSDEKVFKIFNIKTNELLRLEASMTDLNNVMLALLKGKFQKQTIKVDEDFIYDCKKYLTDLFTGSSL
jgi:hypothetical protein